MSEILKNKCFLVEDTLVKELLHISITGQNNSSLVFVSDLKCAYIAFACVKKDYSRRQA